MPIIEPNPRNGPLVELEPDRARPLGERSAVDWVNSNLKEHYRSRWGRVRGAAKVMAHRMLGLLALTAEALLRLAG